MSAASICFAPYSLELLSESICEKSASMSGSPAKSTAIGDIEGFDDSGADWLDVLKPYIEDGQTIVTSPHKVYGPQTNDLALQLRKRGIDKVVLAGMSANLCTEAHMRQLVEDGFDVTVVKDATAAAQHPELGDGYAAALINFGFIASAVITTEEAVAAIAA